MTIAEKLELVATKQQDVYNAGYNKGIAQGGSSVPEDKVIWKTAVGNPICLRDVSEISHQIQIELISETITDFSEVQVKVDNRNLHPPRVNIGYTISGAGVGSTITIIKSAAVGTLASIPMLPSTYYTFSLDNSVCKVNRMCELDKNGICTVNHSFYVSSSIDHSVFTFKTNPNTASIRIALIKKDGSNMTGSDVTQARFQLQRASQASDYLRYQKVYLTGEASGLYVLQEISDAPYLNLSVENPDIQIRVTYQQSWSHTNLLENLSRAIQQNGTRIAYDYAYSRFKDDFFYPRYDIIPTNWFAYCFFASQIANIKKRMDEMGVKLDTSKATSLAQAFRDSETEELGEINCNGVTISSGITYLFYQAKNLRTIEKFIINNAKITSFERTFLLLQSLINITIEGEISYSCSVKDSKKLSKDSIISFVNALSDSASGKTLTLSKAAVCAAFEVEDPVNSAEWTALVNGKGNWSISLV